LMWFIFNIRSYMKMNIIRLHWTLNTNLWIFRWASSIYLHLFEFCM
jgi:hypothetical protein